MRTPVIALLGILFAVTPFLPQASADTAINYFFDDLDRLERIEYADGRIISYTYDEDNNRTLSRVFYDDTTPPTTTVTLSGGSYGEAQEVTLACSDNLAGCQSTHYTLDGTEPTIDSPVYSTPILVSTDTALKYRSYDKNGNAGDVETQVYIIDTEGPTGSLTIAGGAQFSTSNTASLALACSDNKGACAKMQFSNDDTSWSSPESFATSRQWTLSHGDGEKTVRARLIDDTGNVTVVSDQITKDTKPPVSTATPVGGSYNQPQSVALSCADATSGCDGIRYTLSGATPSASSPLYTSALAINADTTLKYMAFDAAGNNEEIQTQSYVIDSVAPTGSMTINSGSEMSNTSTVTLSLACSDNKGCATMRFSNDGQTWSDPQAFSAQAQWPLTAGDGQKSVRARFADAAGNIVTVSDSITLDATAPETSADLRGGNYADPQTVSLTCSDATSGCLETRYTLDNSIPDGTSAIYTDPINITEDAILKYRSYDKAGNAEEFRGVAYFIDQTGPTASVSINTGDQYANSATVSLLLTCYDTNGACPSMQFSNDGSTWSQAQSYSGSISWTLPGGDGIKTVHARFTDGFGNQTQVSDSIVLDTSAPTTTASPGGGLNTQPLSVSLTCADTSSGCKEIRYSLNGTTPGVASPKYSAPLAISEDTTLKVSSLDVAGNWETTKTHIYTFSTQTANAAPAVTAGPDATVTLPNAALLSGSASDDGLPDPPGTLTIAWASVSGPGEVTFSAPSAAQAEATFSAPGIYVLRLSADDGQYTSTDDVTITVASSSTPPSDEVHVFTTKVSSASDDAEESGTGWVWASYGYIDLGNNIQGIRFQNVNVPQGAQIKAAFIQFTEKWNSVGSANILLKGELSGNSPAFEAQNYNLSSRATTQSSLLWAAPTWAWGQTNGPEQKTPDLKEIVQEIVNQGGWASGHALSFIVTGGDGKRTAHSYNSSPDNAPELVIEYSGSFAFKLKASDSAARSADEF